MKRLRRIVRPVSLAITDVQDSRICKVIEEAGPGGIFLNAGSKSVCFSGNVINLDIAPCDGVNLISDAAALAVKSDCVDGVCIIALLEIVEDPALVLSEIYRVLKPGGKVVAATPFLQSYHPDPVDTHRFTIRGARKLFADFEIEEIVPTRGVFGSFLGLFCDFLSVLLSFNSKFLLVVNSILFSWILWPFKFLDRLLPNFRNAEYVSSSFTIVARKPDGKSKEPAMPYNEQLHMGRA